MKLLIDQNLAPRLAFALQDVYPGSTHVRDLGLHRASDHEIWRYAVENGYTIVSKDADFRHMCFLAGPPPKVVGVRFGNCSTDRVLDALRERGPRLAVFDGDAEATLLTLV